jgi:hypothetical protein
VTLGIVLAFLVSFGMIAAGSALRRRSGQRRPRASGRRRPSVRPRSMNRRDFFGDHLAAPAPVAAPSVASRPSAVPPAPAGAEVAAAPSARTGATRQAA